MDLLDRIFDPTYAEVEEVEGVGYWCTIRGMRFKRSWSESTAPGAFDIAPPAFGKCHETSGAAESVSVASIDHVTEPDNGRTPPREHRAGSGTQGRESPRSRDRHPSRTGDERPSGVRRTIPCAGFEVEPPNSIPRERSAVTVTLAGRCASSPGERSGLRSVEK